MKKILAVALLASTSLMFTSGGRNGSRCPIPKPWAVTAAVSAVGTGFAAKLAADSGDNKLKALAGFGALVTGTALLKCVRDARKKAPGSQ